MAKKKKSNIKALYLVIGALFGIIAGKLLKNANLLGDDKASGGEVLLTMLLMMASVYVFYFLGIIIHEAGHLVMGLLTGYKFVSFRIGSFILVRQDGKFTVRRFALAGTAGQCLMTHDMVEKDEDIPYFWYHAGGVLFNFISAALLGLVYLNTSSKFLALCSFIGIFVYAVLGLVNLLPLKKFGIANDGSNILEYFRDPAARRSMLNVLIINGEQEQGRILDSMPDELFEIRDGDESISAVNIKMYCASRELERGDHESAKALFKAILEKKGLIDLFVREAKCELLYCYIMTGEPAEAIDELYSEELQKYIILSGKFAIGRHRLMYAYYYIYKHDKENADKEYNLAFKMSQAYHNLGDAKAEMALIERIKEKY